MGRYKDAVPVIEKYLSEYPQGKYASRAYLFLGKAFLGQLKFDDAARVFDDGTRLFPETLEGHKCRYKRAVIDLLQGDNAAARVRFANLSNNPDGPLGPEARAFQRYLED
jgi:TolA-binding protein